MKTHTTIKSWGSLALGLFFTAVTARTIFDDVWNGADVNIAHVNAAAALVGAIAAGHMAWPALRRGWVVAAVGLSMMFLAATAYIATSAGARNAEVSQNKAAGISKTNEARASAKAKLAEAEADLDDAKLAANEAA